MLFPDRRALIDKMGINPEMEKEWNRLLDEYWAAMPCHENAGKFLAKCGDRHPGLIAENYNGKNYFRGWDKSMGDKESFLSYVDKCCVEWDAQEAEAKKLEEANAAMMLQKRTRLGQIKQMMKDGKATQKDKDELLMHVLDLLENESNKPNIH